MDQGQIRKGIAQSDIENAMERKRVLSTGSIEPQTSDLKAGVYEHQEPVSVTFLSLNEVIINGRQFVAKDSLKAFVSPASDIGANFGLSAAGTSNLDY